MRRDSLPDRPAVRRYATGRRGWLVFLGLSPVLAWVRPARAAAREAVAAGFIHQAGVELAALGRAGGSADQKQAALKGFLDRVVDMPGLARFCLGRFWPLATPDYQRRYVTSFGELIVLNVRNRLGTYQGGEARVTVGQAQVAGDDYEVPTKVLGDGAAPVAITWRVSFASGEPKIVDVSAEGVSLRLTLRQDFSGFLQQNSNDFESLLGAMRRILTNQAAPAARP